MLLDSFDGRLRAAGRGRAAAAKRGTATIELRECGAPVRRAAVAPARRHLTHELPEGAVRERLEPVLEERALLPMARVRSSVRSLAVLNGDEKSVVRLSIEAPVAVLATGRVPLATRLSVRPVLGYDGAYERTLAALRDELGLQAAKRSLYDDAVRATGGKPRGVATKVRVQLDPGTRADAAAALVLRRLATVARPTAGHARGSRHRSSCTTCACRSGARVGAARAARRAPARAVRALPRELQVAPGGHRPDAATSTS